MIEPWLNLKGEVLGMEWPRILTGDSAQAMALQFQLQQTQYYSKDTLEQMQLDQASRLLSHAQRHVPYYSEQIPREILRGQLTLENFRQIPILRRAQVVDAGEQLLSVPLLRNHDLLSKVQTSGSTGMPVMAYGTQVTRFLWDAFTLREHLWQQRDFDGTLLAIRPGGQLAPGEILRAPGWGGSVNQLFSTGPGLLVSASTDIDTQVKLVRQENPEYLLSLASNLYQLLLACDQADVELPGLKQIRSYGEVCRDELRTLAEERFGVQVVDAYSTQELGYIALQCPEANLHVQSEGILLEIVNQHGQPCAPGEVGEVLVTTLSNFAFPLIRYAPGDFAAFGEPCRCGRHLPVLQQVAGRERNMLRRPDGSMHWPSFPASAWARIGSIRQLQIIQESLTSIRVLLVVGRPFTESEHDEFVSLLQTRFDYPFQVTIEYVEQVPRSQSGKYEDFKSLL